MRFVAISDTHCRHNNLKLPKGDVVLHAGDVTYRGEKSEVVDFLQWFSKLPFKHKIFIAGNHDFFLEKEAQKRLQSIIPEGVTYLNDSGTKVGDISIWGSPVTPWFFNWAFNRKRGAPIKKHWDLIPADTDIVITHGPVYGIHDTVLNDKHVGCQDLLVKLQEVKPKIHVCGHIHEAIGDVKRKGIRYINASILNERYEMVYKPVVFDL